MTPCFPLLYISEIYSQPEIDSNFVILSLIIKINTKERGINVDKETFKKALVADAKKRDWYSFKKVVDFAEEHGISACGDYVLGQSNFNIVYWSNLSEELSEIINELIISKQLFYHPTEYLTYLIDGCILEMPVVKRVPNKNGYKKPHWWPLCLRVVPMK